MALCEQGYLCDVCGHEVEVMEESDLYLRFVLGEVDPEQLHVTQERHIRCNPTLAQFIVLDGFEPVVMDGFFAKANLDPSFVRDEEIRITRAYRRIQSLPGSGLPITEYPLPEVREKWINPPGSQPRVGSPWVLSAPRTEVTSSTPNQTN